MKILIIQFPYQKVFDISIVSVSAIPALYLHQAAFAAAAALAAI